MKVNNTKNIVKYSRPLIATMLVSSGLLQLAAPVFAEGTAAGTSLSNTATASYEDPTDPTKPLNTTSNTVVVTVAEVAGITITSDTYSLTKGTANGLPVSVTNPVNTGTAVEAGDTVAFVYNVTNVGNDPSKLRIAGTAGIVGPGTVQKVEVSTDGGTTYSITVPNGGEYISDSKDPGQSIKVRVTVQVTPGAAPNSEITATLGNTAAPGQQNVPLVANGNDVYTVDNIGTANGDVAGDPVNGVREASAFQKITVGATPQAYATITKVRDAAGVTANTLKYTLGLSVANSAPIGTNKIAEDLAGTPIKLDSTTASNQILVSDAVPAGTKIKTLTAPSGWQAVYTLSATTTNANDANWVTAPVDLTTVVGTITRVGFVKNGSNPTVAKGVTVSGFEVVVELLNSANSITIGNIAQIFGSTKLNNTGAPDPSKPVYDESGDNKPNNFNDDGSAPTTNPVTDGVVVPANLIPADIDNSNNNTGTGAAGEPNVYQYVPPAQQGILNGTEGKPDAAGPTGQNDDFTNKSTPISTTDAVRVAGVLPTIDPGSVSFANTFKSTTTDNVSLLPQIGNLPNGSKVTINYGGTSKVYAVTGGVLVNDGTATPATALVVTGVAANTNINYGVDVDLPSGATQLTGYSVPIVAFVDTGTPGLDAGDKQNTTIDRLYTGYLDVKKESQILGADGSTVIIPYSLASKAAAPGQMIQYRITYTNISDAVTAGSGSVGLSAQKIKITEDGTASPNNWGVLNAGKLNTLHKAASAADTNSGAIVFSNGLITKNNNDSDVTKYVNTVAGPLTGQQAGSFTFTRIVNPN